MNKTSLLYFALTLACVPYAAFSAHAPTTSCGYDVPAPAACVTAPVLHACADDAVPTRDGGERLLGSTGCDGPAPTRSVSGAPYANDPRGDPAAPPRDHSVIDYDTTSLWEDPGALDP